MNRKRRSQYWPSLLSIIASILAVFVISPVAYAGTSYYISGDWDSLHLSEVRYENTRASDKGSVTISGTTFTMTSVGYEDALGCGQSSKTTLTITTNKKVDIIVDAQGTSTASESGTYEANSKLVFTLDSAKGDTEAAMTATINLTITPIEETNGTPTDAARYHVSTTDSYYYYLDSAITAAGSSGTITVVGSGTVYAADANLDTFTIPQGVKLLIPHSAEDTGFFGNTHYTSTSDYNTLSTMTELQSAELVEEDTSGSVRSFAFRTLKLPSRYTIVCNGSINVNGKYQENGQPYTGVSLGGHGKLILGEETTTYQGNTTNAQLVIGSTGKLYCYGYITGTGMVEVQDGGEISEILQICDWMGGSNASTWKGNTDDQKTQSQFLLSQYYVQNIEAPLKINYGAKAYIEAIITASVVVTNCAQYMGTDGLFILSEEGSYVLRQYDQTTDRMKYSLNGSATVGSLTIHINQLGGITLASSDYVLPINNSMTLIVEESASVTVGTNISVLPGAEIIVQENGVLNLSSNLYLWSYGDWKNGYMYERYGTPQHAPLPYVATLDRVSPNGTSLTRADTSDGTPKYYLKGITNYTSSGKLQVNGLLNITGSGAIIHTSNGSTSADRLVTGSGIINYNSSLTSVPSIYAGYSSVTETPAVLALGNMIGVDDPQNFAVNGVYYGLGNDYNNNWYKYVISVKDGTPGVVSETEPIADGYKTVTMLNADGVTCAVDNVVGYASDGGSFIFAAPGSYSVSVDGTVLTGTAIEGSTRMQYTISDITANKEIVLLETDPVVFTGAVARVYWSNSDVHDDYTSLEAAVADATNVGDRVAVLTDISLTASVTVAKDQNLVLDLNSYTVSGNTNLITNNGTISIVDTSAAGGGTLDNTASTGAAITTACVINSSGATIDKIEDVTIRGSYCALNNAGNISQIGGTSTLAATSSSGGYVLYTSGGVIETIGGSDSDVTLDGGYYGIYMASGAEITNLGGTDGKVTLTSDHSMIHMTGSSKIGTIGGTNSYVNLTQETSFQYSAGIHGIYMEGQSHIGTIGGMNAETRISQNYNNTGKGVCRFLVLKGTASIDLIGGDNAEIYMVQTSKSTQNGIGIIPWASGTSIGKIGGDNVKRIEVIMQDNPLYNASGVIGEVSGDVLFISKDSKVVVTNTGTIGLSAGYFCPMSGSVLSNTGTVNYPEGMGISTYTIPVTSNVDGQTYNCYFIAPTAAEEGIIFDAVSTNVQGETLLNLKFYIPQTFLTDAYTITVTEEYCGINPSEDRNWTLSASALAGLTAETPVTEWEYDGKTENGRFKLDKNGRYVFSQGIAAGEMTSDVTVTVTGPDGVVGIYSTSSPAAEPVTALTRTVKDYADLVAASDKEALKAMYSSMLTYGQYAQAFYEISLEGYDLLTGFDTALTEPTFATGTAVFTTGGTDVGLTASQIMLDLDSKTTLRIYFTLDNTVDPAGLTFDLSKPETDHLTEIQTGTEDGLFYVDIVNIPVAYWDYAYTITVSNRSAAYTVTTDVLAWVRSCLSSNSAATNAEKNMARAMFYFNTAANEYYGK